MPRNLARLLGVLMTEVQHSRLSKSSFRALSGELTALIGSARMRTPRGFGMSERALAGEFRRVVWKSVREGRWVRCWTHRANIAETKGLKSMGWVEKRFQAEEAYKDKAAQLWDSLRDEVGRAVDEFTARMRTAPVERNDCQAKARYCIRVQKIRTSESIEIFLNELDRAVEIQLPGSTHRRLCHYRVNEDATLVFVSDTLSQVVTAEDVCKLALEEFLFPKRQ